MPLLESIIASVPPGTHLLENVVSGHKWTLVVSTHCGLAAVPRDERPEGRIDVQGLSGKALADQLRHAYSHDPLEASLGVAALNSILQGNLRPGCYQPYGIPRAGGKRVGLVGEFAFTERLKTLAAEVIPVEKGRAEAILPGVDIAIISGATVIDHSLETLLAASRPCYTIVFGPSTPLSPILFDYGADQLVGVTVENREVVTDWVVDGTPDLMDCPGLKSVVLRR